MVSPKYTRNIASSDVQIAMITMRGTRTLRDAVGIRTERGTECAGHSRAYSVVKRHGSVIV